MAVHRIMLGDDDLDFLMEARHDLLTQEPLRHGNTVVVCAGCNIVHLASSWDTEGKCPDCNETNTLPTLPPRARTRFLTPPKIVNFDAVPDEILVGQSIRLNWRTEHADYAYLNDRSVDVNGEAVLIPERATTYQLRVENGRATRNENRSVKLFVPRILGFASDTEEIEDNQSVRLNFDLENAVEWEINAYYYTNGNQPIRVGSSRNANQRPNMLWRDSFSFRPSGGVRLQLVARNGSEQDHSRMLHLTARELEILTFDADKVIVPIGVPVKLHWNVKNAHHIEINNNVGVVTGRDFIEFTPTSERDVTLVLTADGPFNRRSTKELRVRIARFENIRPENNGDIRNPLFYIHFDGFNIRHGSVKIYPGDLPVSDSGRIPIHAAEEPTEFIIEAQTAYGDKVSSTINLLPARILDFRLRNNLALIGSPAELRWTTNNSRRLMLDHVGDVTGLDRVLFTVQNHHKVMSLHAWGDSNLQTRPLTIPVYNSPRLESLKQLTLHLDVRFTLNIPIGSMPRFPGLYTQRGYDRAQMYRNESRFPSIIHWIVAPSEIASNWMKRARVIFIHTSKQANLLTNRILRKMRVFNRNAAKRLFSQIKIELNIRRNGQFNKPPDDATGSL